MSDPDTIPQGDAVDNDYTSRPGQKQHIPVQTDEAPIDDPIDPATADSDQQLERDENEAIDTSNIVEGRTRGATKQQSAYREPGDDEGLPGAEDGASRVATTKQTDGAVEAEIQNPPRK
ncbi:hypothetical protein Tdes44962_MAKER07021 [Teratosphaeria destructans]|uniref:Histone chaperone domain-containing protein n=1 Tax=Teratosphaeria destructans TaxID=418781 RepID=A0A9W7W6R4_9PEZI|nr:hypothetical protein Tdes44962_MAKER07021 [Teratosphaeria destructans]